MGPTFEEDVTQIQVDINLGILALQRVLVLVAGGDLASAHDELKSATMELAHTANFLGDVERGARTLP